MILPGNDQGKRSWRDSLFWAALLLPWMVPPIWGPSPSVVPWLVMLLGSALLLSTIRFDGNESMNWPKAAAQAWLFAAAASSLMGLLQYLDLGKYLWPWVIDSRAGVAYGNLLQRNHFATLTNIGVVSLMLLRLQMRDVKSWQELGMSALVVLLAMGNAASGSRVGLLGLLLVVALAMVWPRWRERAILRMAIIALIAHAGAGGLLRLLLGDEAGTSSAYARFASTATDCVSRLNLWANMLELISQRPWLGWGWGELDYAHFIHDYAGVRQCEQLDNAHNLPLHLAVELGVPMALLAMGAGVGLIAREKPWRESKPAHQMAWLVQALIALHSMVEYPLWYGPFVMTAGVCLLLLFKPLKHQWRVAATGVRALGGLLLLAAAYAAWDYYRISQIFFPPDFRAAPYRENTLEKIRSSWLFKEQVRFAEYTTTPLTKNNAEQLHAMGLQVLHFSPEAQVVEKLIESAVLLGRDEEARFYLVRFRAAYPQAHARWAARQRESDKAQ